MNRCILVMGTGRSGTSALAGVVHNLGCNMGDEFAPTDRNNPYGTFEDLELFQATRRIVGNQANPEIYRPIVEARKRKYKLWGVKDPALAHTMHYLVPMLDEVRVIIVRRPPPDIINSYMRAYYAGRVRAEKWYKANSSHLAARLMEFNGPQLAVDFRDLLGEPESVVETVADFVYEGIDCPHRYEKTQAAIKHIVKKPKRKVEGWGSLAIGVRVGQHPEPGFFIDWSALLTGGLRTSDTILIPQARKPAHWASNNIARMFLSSEKDSLLMVDDDMMFDMRSASWLRDNKDNWGFDVVSGFATHRENPPRPIVMKLQNMPPPPQSIKGDSFDLATDFSDGDVVEVDAVGLAFTLIRRHVFEAMVDRDWGVGHTYFFDYGVGVESDDISFMRRCRELGFRIAVDTNVKLKHIGSEPFGWDEYQGWMRGRDQNIDTDAEYLRPILRAVAGQEGLAGMRATELLGKINANARN
jgi:hypothetical protein